MEQTGNIVINFFDPSGAIAGILEVDSRGAFIFHRPFEPQLQNLLAKAGAEGVVALAGMYDQQAETRIYSEERVYPVDPRFIPSLLGSIRDLGYGVVRRYPESETELKNLLGRFPDTDEHKRDILRRLPAMSHLEMTALIEELQK